MKEIYSLMVFIIGFLLLYTFFSNKEGIDTMDQSNSASSAKTFASNIKKETMKIMDTLHIDKYKTDYETAILNLDDYINAKLLQTIMSIDTNNPDKQILTINQLSSAKESLNQAMKFVDSV